MAQELYEQEGISCDLSPYILAREEAFKLQPIYYDLVEHHVIIYDPQSLLANIVEATKNFLAGAGAKKEWYGNTWEWGTEKVGFPGGIELQQRTRLPLPIWRKQKCAFRPCSFIRRREPTPT